MKTIIRIYFFTLCIFLGVGNTLRAEKIIECSNVEALQRALIEASPDDVIRLKPGTYRISEPIYIGRNITLSGVTGNPKDVLLESSGEGCLVLAADAAKVTGLTIRVKVSKEVREKEGANASAVKIRQGKCMLVKCLITSDKDSGLLITGEQTEPRIESCEIYDCDDEGVSFKAGAKGTMANCEIRGSACEGIYVMESADPIIRDCKVYNNGLAGIHSQGKGTKGTYECCEIFGNQYGACTCGEDTGKVFRDCRIYNNLDCGICSATGLFERCHIHDNGQSGISTSFNAIVRGCRIENNGKYGIDIMDNSTFQRNRLSGNAQGNWQLDNDVENVERTDNSPNE